MQISQHFLQAVTNNLNFWLEKISAIPTQENGNLQQKLPDIQQAVSYGLNLLPDLPATGKLLLEVFPAIEKSGRYTSWLPLYEQAIDSSFAANNVSLKGWLLSRTGRLQRMTLQFTRAMETHQEALNLAQEYGDTQLEAEATYNLCENYWHQQENETAAIYGQLALEQFRALNHAERIVASLHLLGMLARRQGDLPAATALLEEAAVLGRSIHQRPIPLARTLNSLGLTYQAQQNYTKAYESYRQAAEILTPTTYEIDKLRVQNCLGTLYFDWERYDEAETTFRQIIRMPTYQQTTLDFRAALYQNIGNSLLKQFRSMEAQSFLERSLVLWQQTNNKLMSANTLGTLADAFALQEKFEIAATYYREALEILSEFSDNRWGRKLYEEFSSALEKLGMAQTNVALDHARFG